MRKRTAIIIVVIVVMAILLVPVKSQLRDGGTVAYTALTYRVTVLNNLVPEAEGEPVERITGTEIELFPFFAR